MIQFLEDYESAFMNIEYVMRSKPLTAGSQGFYTGDGKHCIFVQNFTVPDLTSELIESVEATTVTWDAMVDKLCHCIVKQTVVAQNVARRKAHMASIEANRDNPEVDNHISHFNVNRFEFSDSSFSDDDITSFINMISQNWKVGYKLWQQFTDA